MIIETDWDFYHEWTLLDIAADRAEEYAEEIDCPKCFYKAAVEQREIADNFYEKNQTKIQRHLDWWFCKESK